MTGREMSRAMCALQIDLDFKATHFDINRVIIAMCVFAPPQLLKSEKQGECPQSVLNDCSIQRL